MKNYTMKHVSSNLYDVIETKTELTIRELLETQVASKFMKFLNGGGGFNGFTPEFFNNKIKIQS